jgi:hypothetical protein
LVGLYPIYASAVVGWALLYAWRESKFYAGFRGRLAACAGLLVASPVHIVASVLAWRTERRERALATSDGTS